MKQYWLFCLSAVQDIVFCAIDNAFANNISLDVIIVINTFLIIQYFCLRPMNLGTYAYQALQSRPKNCLVCTLLMSVLVGIILILCAKPLTLLFDLTAKQREALAEAIILFGFCTPIQGTCRFLMNYCNYNNKTVLAIVGSFLTYIPMLIGDWLAVVTDTGAFGLRLATEISWLLYLVVLLPKSDILKTDDKVDFKTIRHCFYTGKEDCISQMITRGATIFMTSMASTLGTVAYAVHAVALGITDLGECFREATLNYGLIELREHRDNLYSQSLKVLKRVFIPALFLPLLLEGVLVITTHGKVEIIDTLVAAGIYSLPFLVYPLYDISAAAIRLSSIRASLLLTSMLTAIWRVPILWVLVQCFGVSIPVLGIIYVADYGTRTLVYRIMLKRDSAKVKTADIAV
jgi:Na+-driven multidrug efflux pump